jgi:hypothetical protein
MRKIYTLLCFLLAGAAAYAQPAARTYIYALTSGNWSSNATWSLNRQPASNDSIVIPANLNVTLSADKALTNVIVDIFGTLTIDEPNGSSMDNDLIITTTNNDPASPVVRLFDVNAKIQRGNNGNGSGRIQVRINNAGTNYIKYVTGNTAITGPATAFNTQVTSFDFTTNGSLPVVLIDFLVFNTDRKVDLKWRSQQENNSDRYIIERSHDGRNWHSIGQIPAVAYSQVPQNYFFSDLSPANGVNYYRLRMTDRDGKFGLTPVKAVRISNTKEKISIYPNPAISTATVYVDQQSAGGYAINVYNKTGQLVANKKVGGGSNVITIDVSRLPMGDYTVDVIGDNSVRQTVRLAVVK